MLGLDCGAVLPHITALANNLRRTGLPRRLVSGEEVSRRIHSRFQSTYSRNEISPVGCPSKRIRQIRILSTLDPTKLLPSDFADISRSILPTFRLGRINITGDQFVEAAKRPTFVRFGFKIAIPVSFPQSTRGFLYYRSPPNVPAYAGQLRFRLTPDNQPSSFGNGSDLMLSNGLPWHIPIWWIACRPLPDIRDLLLRDNLVTDDLLTKCRQLFSDAGLRRTSVVLHALDQPFPIRCDAFLAKVWVVGRNKVEPILIANAFKDNGKGYMPYRGSLLVSFERSSLPQHANTRTIVLRIVKQLEPVTCVVPEYHGYQVEPAEGALLTRTYKTITRPWYRDIDKCSAFSPLRRLLEDNMSS